MIHCLADPNATRGGKRGDAMAEMGHGTTGIAVLLAGTGIKVRTATIRMRVMTNIPRSLAQ